MTHFESEKKTNLDLNPGLKADLDISDLAILRGDLESTAVYSHNLKEKINQIDFLNNLIELLWVTSSYRSSAEFKKCSDQILERFNFEEVFLATYVKSQDRFEHVYQYKRDKKTQAESPFLFEKDLGEIFFQRNESTDPKSFGECIFLSQEERPDRYSWAAGDVIVIPCHLDQNLIGCLVISLAPDKNNYHVFDEIKNGVGNFKFLNKVICCMCTWVRQFKNPSSSGVVSFEARMGLMGVSLSSKQRRILELVALGEANKEIASIVHLSEHAVKYHVGNLLEKFAVTNRAELRTKINQMNFPLNN